MTVTIDKVLKAISKHNKSLVTKASDFGLEFSPSSPKQLSSSIVKGIALSPFVSLSLFPFMRENDLNFIISVLGMPFFSQNLPLSDYDYEVIKALSVNNYKTFKLGKNWLYSDTGAFRFFFQGLGFKDIKTELSMLPFGGEVLLWNIGDISLGDFLHRISHHTTSWFCVSKDIKTPLGTVVIDHELSLSDVDTNYLQREGINTILSFSMDTIKLSTLRPLQLNYVTMPFIPVVNLALKRLAQVIELELEVKTLAYPHSGREFINYLKLKQV